MEPPWECGPALGEPCGWNGPPIPLNKYKPRDSGLSPTCMGVHGISLDWFFLVEKGKGEDRTKKSCDALKKVQETVTPLFN